MCYTRSFGNFRKQNENFGIFLKIWILFKKFGNFWTFWKLWKITSYNFQSRRQKIWRWEGYIDPSSVQFSNNLLIMKLWTPVGWVQFGAGGICHGGANCLQVGQDIGPWILETLESEVCLNETFFSLVIVGLAVSIILFILSQVDKFKISKISPSPLSPRRCPCTRTTWLKCVSSSRYSVATSSPSLLLTLDPSPIRWTEPDRTQVTKQIPSIYGGLTNRVISLTGPPLNVLAGK